MGSAVQNSGVQLAELERQHQRNLVDHRLSLASAWPIRPASIYAANCAMAATWPSTLAASRARSSPVMPSRLALTAC